MKTIIWNLPVNIPHVAVDGQPLMALSELSMKINGADVSLIQDHPLLIADGSTITLTIKHNGDIAAVEMAVELEEGPLK